MYVADTEDNNENSKLYKNGQLKYKDLVNESKEYNKKNQ